MINLELMPQTDVRDNQVFPEQPIPKMKFWLTSDAPVASVRPDS
jgi:hypothetical protein